MPNPTIKIAVSQADATLVQTCTLTAGMQNTPTVKFSFSEEWTGMGKTAVVRAGSVCLELLITNNQITVPYEALEVAGVNLIIGVYGTDTAIAIPTVWCACGEILDGTDVEEPSNVGVATPTLVDQMLAYADDIEAIAETLDGLAIRTVAVNTTGANQYGIASVTLNDTGAGDDRTLTFYFSNLKGNGIESITWSASGTYKGRIQITQSNGTVTNFDALVDAISYLDSLTNRSEAYAVGTINGVDVEDDDPAYHNNSKYYAEQASGYADTANSAKASAMGFASSASGSKTAAEAAQTAAEAAQASAELAASEAASARETVISKVAEASGYADRTTLDSTAAQTAASNAATSETNAAASASAASASATSASASASTATTKANEASASASAAGASANSASSSASTATTKASEASASATAAGNAQTAAETAQSAAEDAQEAAETAAATFTTDTTLSVSGKAADAKVTGDEIGDLKSALTGLNNNRIYIDSKNDLTTGGVASGEIGDTISFGTQEYWTHIEKNVFKGEKYEFVINRTNTNLGYYCFFTDSNNKIISRDITGDTTDDWHIKNTVIVPANVSKMFIVMFANLQNSKTCFQLYKIITNVQYQLDTVIDNEYHLIDITDKITNGLVDGNTGNTISIGTQSYWTHAFVSVNDCSAIKFITNSTGTNTSWYVYFVDGSNKIVQRCVNPNTSDDWLIEHYLDVPGQAENVYIVAFANITNANAHMKVYKRYSKTTNQRIYEIENNLFGDGLPDYYHTDNWLENKIAEINELSAIKNGAVFAFFTDIHLPSNAKNSRYLLRSILRKTTVPLVICGGDIVGAYGTESDVKEQAHEWIQYCAEIEWDKILQIQGNHDYTIKTLENENTGWTATDEAIYNYVMRKQETRVFCPSGKRYWYYDLPGNLRIIGFCGYERINSGNVPWGVEVYQEQAEYNWLMNVAMPANGYKFIVITHASPDRSGNIPASGGAACLYAMLNAMNNKTTFSQLDGSGDYTVSGDYTNATSEVICVISGHNHKDASDDSNGVLYITTTSDACYNDDPNTIRTKGTVSEQAVDVFCIDTDARTIKTVRVGGGINRNWSY